MRSTREYYDRHAYTTPGHRRATSEEQDAYWILRSSLTSAIAHEWDRITAAFPDIEYAADNLNRLIERRPHTSFRIFRPEDCSTENSASDRHRVVLR